MEHKMSCGRNLYQIVRALRDLVLPVLPRIVARILAGNYRYAFIAHPLDLADLARQYPFAACLSKNQLKLFSRFLWPVLGSQIIGFKKQDGTLITGIVIFCPLTTRMLVLKRQLARKRIAKAACLAEKLGAKIVGLGAFIPIVTEHGRYVKDKISASVTSGTTFSAVIAAQNALQAAKRMMLDTSTLTLGIIGAAGGVGSVCTALLANHFASFILVDKNLDGVEKAGESLRHINGTNSRAITVTNQITAIYQADVIISTTNTPGAIVRSHHLRPGTIVIDAAQPRNVSTKVSRERTDVLVIESGIAEIDGLDTHFDFVGLLERNEGYSCLAEILLMLWLDIGRSAIGGQQDVSYANQLLAASKVAGIKIARFRNVLGYISDDDISRVRKARYPELDQSQQGRQYLSKV